MRTPEALETLVEYGIVEEVLRPLMSGKEAQIFLVVSGGELRVAKVYKDAQQRSFKQRADYTEGRKSRNTRDQRAMAKHSKHGKAQDEAAWRSAEVNAIYRLSAAGVRVPVPYHFVDGVLVMELVKDADGNPAPRLGDLLYDPATAQRIFDHLLVEVVRMLCAGVVHGDLSEFNVLMAADGPVVIDFPQAVDPASNLGARTLLLRDVDNLHRFLGRFVRGGRPPPYAQEMWDLYQRNLLTPETQLRGRFVQSQRPTNTADVLALIGEAEREHRRGQGGGPGPRPGPQRGGGGPPRGPRTDGGAPRGPRPDGARPGPSTQAQPSQSATPGPRGPKVEVQMTGPRGPRPGPQDGASRGPGRGVDDGARGGARGPEQGRGPEPRASQGPGEGAVKASQAPSDGGAAAGEGGARRRRRRKPRGGSGPGNPRPPGPGTRA